MNKKVLAHRGFSSRYPENTLLSLRKALELGADGVEFDVQLTKDGVPVIIHDESLLRTGGKDVMVRDLTLSELRQIDVSFKFHDACGFCPVPTLEEYFELVKDRDFLTNIELKTAIFEYTGIEQKVIDMIRAYGLTDRIILSSFNHYSLLRAKAIAPEIPCGILYECRIAEPQEYAKRLNIEYLHPCYIFLNDEETAKYQAEGIASNPWTIDKEEDIRYFLNNENIFAIISNKPDLVMALQNGQ